MSCEGDCPKCLADAAHPQPPNDREFITPDGVFIKEMFLAKAGTVVPQHAHTYAHTSFLVAGSVRVWADGEYRDWVAPKPIVIAARVKHKFVSLTDGVLVLCIHNLNGAAAVSIASEATFEGH